MDKYYDYFQMYGFSPPPFLVISWSLLTQE